MKLVLEKLMLFSRVHELNCGLTKEQIADFEVANKINLPQELKELYKQFDGGELFIPGTTVYGLFDNENTETIRNKNKKSIRGKMSMPYNYLIFAKLNYGDFVCVNLNAPYDVIQWSHEDDEVFCIWDSIEQWLSEMIADYEEYEADE